MIRAVFLYQVLTLHLQKNDDIRADVPGKDLSRSIISGSIKQNGSDKNEEDL